MSLSNFSSHLSLSVPGCLPCAPLCCQLNTKHFQPSRARAPVQLRSGVWPLYLSLTRGSHIMLQPLLVTGGHCTQGSHVPLVTLCSHSTHRSHWSPGSLLTDHWLWLVSVSSLQCTGRVTTCSPAFLSPGLARLAA